MTESLPISSAVLYNELETATAILTKWKEQPVPGDDVPAAADAQLRWLTQLIGELQVVSAKCDALAEVLATARD